MYLLYGDRNGAPIPQEGLEPESDLETGPRVLRQTTEESLDETADDEQGTSALVQKPNLGIES